MTLANLLDIIVAQQQGKKHVSTITPALMMIWDDDAKFDFESMKKQLGRKWRVQCANLVKLITRCQQAPNPACFEMSVYDKRLMVAFGGVASTITRTIQTAISLGLMACIDSSYVFGAKDASRNFSKKYSLNEKLAKLFLEANLQSNISNPNNQNSGGPQENSTGNSKTARAEARKESILSNDNGLYTLDCRFAEDGKFAYKTRKNGVCTYKIADSEECPEPIKAFYGKFPFLRKIQDEAAEINGTFYRDFDVLKSQWIPTLDGDKVGFRATTRACLTKKGEERQSMVFDPYFGAGKEIYEFDVKASVYTINKWMRHGITDDVQDVYREISPIALDDAHRAAFKSLCQMIYFNQYPARTGANICHNLRIFDAGAAREVQSIADDIRARMIGTIGEPLQKDVFIYESCVYHRLLQQLLADGFKIVQVYDCFYSDDRAAIERAEAILPQIAEATLREIGAIAPARPKSFQMKEEYVDADFLAALDAWDGRSRVEVAKPQRKDPRVLTDADALEVFDIIDCPQAEDDAKANAEAERESKAKREQEEAEAKAKAEAEAESKAEAEREESKEEKPLDNEAEILAWLGDLHAELAAGTIY